LFRGETPLEGRGFESQQMLNGNGVKDPILVHLQKERKNTDSPMGHEKKSFV